MTGVIACAASLGLPVGDEAALRRLVERQDICRAMLDVRAGLRPEQAAAIHDLPWIDAGPASGVDWRALEQPSSGTTS